MDELDKLIDFVIKWAAKNDFKIVVPNDDDKEIDFININLKTKTLYVDELNIDKPLTEIG